MTTRAKADRRALGALSVAAIGRVIGQGRLLRLAEDVRRHGRRRDLAALERGIGMLPAEDQDAIVALIEVETRKLHLFADKVDEIASRYSGATHVGSQGQQ